MLMFAGHRRTTGFTLIELMVAMALGLIIASAVTSLVVANINASNASIKGMRATEEARALNEIITREIRRARFDGSALGRVGSGAGGTTFNTIDAATTGCLKFAYDANGNGAADSGEFRMLSRQVVGSKGVVRYGQFADSASIDCTGGHTISSDDIDVECLRFINETAGETLTGSSANACFNGSPSGVSIVVPADSIYFSLRVSLKVDAVGQSLSTTRRRTDGVVMIRSP